MTSIGNMLSEELSDKAELDNVLIDLQLINFYYFFLSYIIGSMHDHGGWSSSFSNLISWLIYFKDFTSTINC